MKKRQLFSLLIPLLILTGCDFFGASPSNNNNDSQSSKAEGPYTITWNNYNGDLLYKEFTVEKGEIPIYDGKDPIQKGNAEFTYTFKQWKPEVVPATKDATYTAVYTQTRTPYQIDGMELVNDDNVEIKIINGRGYNLHGFMINFTFKNKTNTHLYFRVMEGVINSYMTYPTLSGGKAVNTGETLEAQIQFSPINLQEAGITTIDRLELYIQVNSSSPSSSDVVNEKFTLYPSGLNEEEIASPPRPTTKYEEVIFERHDFSLIVIDAHRMRGPFRMILYLENKLIDVHLTFYWYRILINGKEIVPAGIYNKDGIPYITVPPNSKCITEVGFYTDDFIKNEIVDVDAIVVTLHVSEEGEANTGGLFSDTFTYLPISGLR